MNASNELDSQNTSARNQKQNESKVRRAAKMLLALGEENAALVLRHLDQNSMEKIARELVYVPKLDPQEKEELLSEFNVQLQEQSDSVKGGKEEARRLLVDTLGEEKAQPFLQKLEKASQSQLFHEFEQYPAETIAQLLSTELAQTAAVVLAQLTPSFSAKVLKSLPNDMKAPVAKRIAQLQQISPEGLQAIYTSLKERLANIDQEESQDSDGEDKLSNIMRYLDSESEDSIMNSLSEEEPQMAERIREKLYSFEDLIDLPTSEIRKVVEYFPDQATWAKALKGTGADLSRHILGSLSVNRSADLQDEIQHQGALPLREIEEARRLVMRKVEELEEKGQLFLHRNREDFVE